MTITEQTNTLIATIEKSIAQKEDQLKELNWEIKKETAQLKKLKAVFLQNADKGNKTPLSEDKPA